MVTDYLDSLIQFCPNWGKLDCYRIILFDFREFLDKKSVFGTVWHFLNSVHLTVSLKRSFMHYITLLHFNSICSTLWYVQYLCLRTQRNCIFYYNPLFKAPLARFALSGSFSWKTTEIIPQHPRYLTAH